MKTTLFALLIASFLLVPFSKSYSQAVNVNDSLALVDLYNSTDGAHWTNNSGWLTASVNSWFGITVTNNRVTQIYFNYDNILNGTLPSSIGNLSELNTFVIDGNNISGSIPSSFGKLLKLTNLSMESCAFSGSIPSSLGKLTSLTNIDLQHNQLSGSIPASLGNLPNLRYIQLDNNNLTGSVPSSFSNLTKLGILGVSNNKLSGKFPSLVNCTQITDLFLENNAFTGPIPDFHSANPFGEIHLDYNQFSGSIPLWLGNMTRAAQITLAHNKLTGSIPTSIENLSSQIGLLWLSDNQLSGPVPVSLINLQYAWLSLENNHFTYDGLEDIIKSQTSFYDFTYSPQLNIPINYTPQGAFGKLSVHAGGTLSNNTYQWFKNNSLFKTNVGDSTFVPDAEGVYSVKVNNGVVTNLLLVSDNITIVTACASAPVNTTTTNIQSTSAKVSWSASQGAIKYTVQFKPVSATTFSSVTTKTTTATLKNLLPNTQYVWKVRATCSLQNSAFTALNNFTSPPSFAGISQANSVSENPGTISIYPNPAKDVVRIKGLEFNSEAVITILDVQGRKIINAANSKTNEIDVKQLNAGTYFVRIEAGKNVTTLKFVKE